jgi:conjugative relaxase-like TrwC/TraI family protein
MLSITTLKSASQASSYYEADNYYAKDSPEAQEASAWWGKGAQLLGLNGTVEPAQFQALLEGQLPNGQQLGRIENGEVVHRPGIDLTFSAPKSVSILSEIGEDKRIHAAHEKAVDATLSYLQTHAAQTRRSENGEIIFDKTDNLIVAQFRHDTSREHDPQLHTHCVLINATQRDDGQWRSLSCESFFDQKMLAGTLYRSTLAFELQQQGYTIEKTHADGRFEIAGIPKSLMDDFSKRRQAIEAALKERSLESAKAAEVATLLTRQSKQSIDREALHQQWKETCNQAGFDAKQAVQNAINQTQQKIPDINPQQAADHAVQYAYQHLSEREAVFTQASLLKTAVALSIGDALPQHIHAAITRAEKQHALLPITRESIAQWTTPHALRCEKETIDHLLDGRQILKPIANTERVDKFLSEKSYLNDGQKNAVHLILTTQDRIVGVQGYAGTGKTTMLAAVKEFAEAHGFHVKGIAPSAAAANQIREGAGIESSTLASYLLEHAKQGQLVKSESKTIFVLDESSMASTTQMNALLKSVHHNKSRLVLVGDTQQLGAVEAGKPFHQLQKAGMQTATMSHILRQKDAQLLQAVHHSITGDIQAALKKIGNHVSEIENKDRRLEQLAKHYLALSPEKRETALVLTPANEDRARVNTMIRNGLKQTGYLQGSASEQTVLINKGLTRAERMQAHHYAIGNVVRFNKNFTSLQIKSGDYLEVTHIDTKTNAVSLKSNDSKTIQWQPDKIAAKREGAIEVYQKEQRDIRVGDTLRWQRNDRQHSLINSETAKVLASIKLQNGKMISIDLHKPNHQHWDHAYATTVHAAQGKTCDIVIAHGESFRKNLTNQQAFYVTISRARYEVHLYTDDKQAYFKTLQKHIGEKTSALNDNSIRQKETSIKSNAFHEYTQITLLKSPGDREYC